ncbi:MAG: dienelactone hydrolase family protein [Deltaproteobacteria bacterium]|nr:dienelactone hydrolase family protein [Deltaproteobacteria bacterium]
MGTQLQITTDDGTCPAFSFGDRALPGVLLYIDGIGMRPAMHEIAERVAAAGFHVLMPDLFYRMGAYTAPEPAKLFSDEELRTAWFGKAFAAASQEKCMRDTKAFLAHFGDRRIGTTGYCMGGRMSLVAAGTYPDRIAASAAYHPGNVVTEKPDSPHLLAPKIKASIYVGGAKEDSTFSDEHKRTLESALTAANVDHQIETYPAMHGWVPSDTPVHDPAQAERHFETMIALFKKSLT